MTTMISDPPKNTTMGVGFAANRRRAGEPEAWKSAIGTRQVSARLALLPESKPRWDRIVLSAIGQLVIVTVVVLIPLIYPDRIKTALNSTALTLEQPVLEVPVAPEPPKVKPRALPKVEPKPVIVEPVKLNPKQPHIFMQPKVLQPKVQIVDVK